MIAFRNLIAALIAFSVFVYRADAGDTRQMTEGKLAAAPVAAIGLAEGEVRKIDKETGKVTIKHGPLVDLDMPAMTMVFRVKDPTMLDQLKSGDKIRFEAAKVGGAYTVMQFEIIKR